MSHLNASNKTLNSCTALDVFKSSDLEVLDGYSFASIPLNKLPTDLETWEKFNGAQDNPDDSTDFPIPVLEDSTAVTGWDVGSIYDKMGLPTGVPGISNVNALPFRAYNLIWNEWYPDSRHCLL